MKYLYDYECEKNKFSARSELDAAIEGNKREGRRTSAQYESQTAALVSINKAILIDIVRRQCYFFSFANKIIKSAHLISFIIILKS